MKRRPKNASASRVAPLVLLGAAGFWASAALGQTTLPLNDLNAFQNPGKTWRVAGDVAARLTEDNVLVPAAGTGVLINLTDKNEHGADLFTTLEHGDADIELDYLMAKGSNSGIYLQGRYEIQLLDSWGVRNPKAGDNGGIYERWDESKPEGRKGYEGYAPRQNVSKAPGLWQHMKISFQAPRFDAGGRKLENARIIRVELNGVAIHEDVELSGVTRGAMGNDEKPTGPLRIQGDHGSIAFRNIKITNYNKPRPELTDLKYSVYKGKFDKEPDFAKLPPEAEGPSVILTSNVSNLNNEFLIRYTGTLKVHESGEYSFNLSVPGGQGVMRINRQMVVPISEWSGRGKVTLPAGDLPFEVLYNKTVDWAKPAIGLAVAGPGIREYLISETAGEGNDPVDPILVDAPVPTVIRSFMDIGNRYRVVHAVNVGSPEQVHYTYDMDFGTPVQIWRGGFLDATPMWHERGDGSSRPQGTVIRFGQPKFSIARLSSPDAAWSTDSVGTSYRPKGYTMDEKDRPTFRYSIYGTMVSDAIRVLEDSHGLRREITLENTAPGLYVRLADGATIDAVSNNLYVVDGKSYYLQLDDAGGASPVVRDANGRKELIVPIQKKISYTLLF